MPTYAYECEKCGHRFERRQDMSDAPVKKCPECGGKVERLISSGVAVIFKGETGGGSSGAGTSCGKSCTCCGRTTRCAKPPCNR